MITIVIPAYNEDGGLDDTLASCRRVMVGNAIPYEIVVVDDGSQTPIKINGDEHVRILRNLENLGYGASLKRGIAVAKYDTIAIMDADNTYPADELPAMLGLFNQGYDLVIGDRSANFRDASLFKKFSRFWLRWLVEFTTSRKISDVNSGFRVFSAKAATKYFNSLSDGFSFTTSMCLIYFLLKKFVAFHPINYQKRVGKTKVRFVRDTLRALQYIFELLVRFNPIKLFVLLAIAPAISGLAFLVSAFAHHHHQNQVYILCAVILLSVSYLLVSTGILMSKFKVDEISKSKS